MTAGRNTITATVPFTLHSRYLHMTGACADMPHGARQRPPAPDSQYPEYAKAPHSIFGTLVNGRADCYRGYIRVGG